MPADPVLKELWRVKDEIAAQYNYDVRALCKALREEEQRSGHPLVSRRPKTQAQTTP